MINKGYATAKTDKESDEVFTPEYAVKPLIKYLEQFKKDPIIWCPFDLKNSAFVKIFKDNGFKVISSHIDNGENFFYFEPKQHYDIIISNPPFSQKDDVLKRLTELNKPFAMLLPVATLQGQKRFPYLQNIQYLGFDKRINFYKKGINTKGIPFATCYICKNFLPKDLIIEKL